MSSATITDMTPMISYRLINVPCIEDVLPWMRSPDLMQNKGDLHVEEDGCQGSLLGYF